MAERTVIYCLTGCTAVGKTDLALEWAEARGAEIINCDSLLFYRGMDVGTAKPSAQERRRVPHHLIDIAEPSEPMDVGAYVELARAALQATLQRGKTALVTGGSGFYLKAFFEPVVDAVAVSAETRAQAEALLAEGLPVAVEALESLNPEGLEGLDLRNPRRVARALERCLQTGWSLKRLKEAFQAQSNPLTEAQKRLVVLERERDDLAGRIQARVDRMLQSGLIEEVEALLGRGIERNPSAARAIGYRETIAYLKGELDYASLRESIATSTRRLAKKQRTWFRGQLPAQARFLNLTKNPEPAIEELFA